MHMKTDLLNGICDVRPGEGEVLKSPSKAPVGSRVGNRIAHGSRNLALSVDRSGTRLATTHPCSVQNIQSILSLVEEEARGPGLHSDTQEVMEHTQILHSKLLLQ